MNLTMHTAQLVASAGPAGGWPALPTLSEARTLVHAWPITTLVAGLVLLGLTVWIARHFTRRLGRAIDRLDGFEGNNPRLDAALLRIDRFLVRTAILVAPLMAAFVLQAPPAITALFLLALRLYLTLAIALVVIRCVGLIVDVVGSVWRRQAARRGWIEYHDRFGALLPTLRLCLEYALWIGLGTALAYQLPYTRYVHWGPRLMLACLVVFAARVVIELGYLEIDRRMILSEGLSDNDRRRRATMAPLVRSAWTYSAYFGTLMLVLNTLGFDVLPFLAGAGIVGLVVGFGAQSMINDVVSGFFILFENIYLVGDYVEVGTARGIVEAIEFRTTKIRDGEGRLHIIRNGDMKPVINYSRDYAVAVVAVDVSYDADLDRVFKSLREAGAVLRARNPDVLADTEVEGITAFGANALTVRTSTRVKPGRHESVAATLRLMLKEAFDRQAGDLPRASLIPAIRPPQRVR
jgi:small conductance mechanosensitive channel